MPVLRPSYLSYPDHLEDCQEKIESLTVGQTFGFKSLARAAVNHSLDLLVEAGETFTPISDVPHRLVLTFTYKGKVNRAIFRWAVNDDGEGKVYDDLNNY